jgi:hypothetical protein
MSETTMKIAAIVFHVIAFAYYGHHLYGLLRDIAATFVVSSDDSVGGAASDEEK